MNLVSTLWHFLFGWAGVDMLIGFAAVAVAIFEPKFLDAITDLRKWAVCVAVVAFTLTGSIAYGYRNGLAEKQRQWDAALVKETRSGEQARSDAESTVHGESSDGVRNDPRNRDNWGKQPESGKSRPVRWLEGHRFFGK